MAIAADSNLFPIASRRLLDFVLTITSVGVDEAVSAAAAKAYGEE